MIGLFNNYATNLFYGLTINWYFSCETQEKVEVIDGSSSWTGIALSQGNEGLTINLLILKCVQMSCSSHFSPRQSFWIQLKAVLLWKTSGIIRFFFSFPRLLSHCKTIFEWQYPSNDILLKSSRNQKQKFWNWRRASTSQIWKKLLC